MKLALVVVILSCFTVSEVALTGKSDNKCIEECLADEWGANEDQGYELARSKTDKRCKDEDGNVVSCLNRATESDVVVGRARQDVHNSCAHCKNGQICVGFPEDEFQEPECVDGIGPCGEQCEIGETCEHVAWNRYNCIPNLDFNICDTCTEDEICLGFPNDSVPNDCYEIDDELPCAGMCEDYESCKHYKANEYHCIPMQGTNSNEWEQQ